MVDSGGLEPPTSSMSRKRSNQLSYESFKIEISKFKTQKFLNFERRALTF